VECEAVRAPSRASSTSSAFADGTPTSVRSSPRDPLDIFEILIALGVWLAATVTTRRFVRATPSWPTRRSWALAPANAP